MKMYERLDEYLERYVDKCIEALEGISINYSDFKSPELIEARNVVNQKPGGGVNPNYDNELTRLIYISKYTYFYGGLYALMYKEILESEQFKEYLLDPDKEIRVLSVGCANQIDLWGLLFTCEKCGIKNRIRYVGCEIEENWKEMTIFGQNPKEEGYEFHYGKKAGDIGRFLDKNSDEYDIVFLPSVFNELNYKTRAKIKKLLAHPAIICGITCHSDEEVEDLGLDSLIDSSEKNYKGDKISDVLEKTFGIDGVYNSPECIQRYIKFTTKEGNEPLTFCQSMENRKRNLSFKILGHVNPIGFALFINKYLEDMEIPKEYHKEIKSKMQDWLISGGYISKDEKRITDKGIQNGMYERKHIREGKESYSIIYYTKGQAILKSMMVDAIIETIKTGK
ncbi:hypothetical protein [Pseudobutyrivibrio sp.]|uniref:hypothetical protein n=1 Tax=Pseudobutyrivibrio sp. TaxID=2014367 RepID=UPI001B69D3A5|nr:hypothetical protein [Pseudobutyrivibrio sp.]MBP3262757.1 hypothetical protein [Pseudobutyrivibrio sp.]